MRASRVLLVPNPSAGPFARLGTLTATGDTTIFADVRKTPGTFTLTGNTSYAGAVKSETFSGSFQVAANCTVHFEYTQPSMTGNVTSSFDGILVEENRQVLFIQSSMTNVAAGSMTRQ